MTTSEEKKCCRPLATGTDENNQAYSKGIQGGSGGGYNGNFPMASTPVREAWEKEFDKEFPVIEQVSEDEADGTFVIKSDADKVKSFIRSLIREDWKEEAEMLQKHYPSPELSLLERLEEEVGKLEFNDIGSVLKNETLRYAAELGFDRTIMKIFSLITHFKKEI